MTAFDAGTMASRLVVLAVDDRKGARSMAAPKTAGDPDDPGDVLAELQRAVQEHERILWRQEELIKRLRDELKGVER